MKTRFSEQKISVRNGYFHHKKIVATYDGIMVIFNNKNGYSWRNGYLQYKNVLFLT